VKGFGFAIPVTGVFFFFKKQVLRSRFRKKEVLGLFWRGFVGSDVPSAAWKRPLFFSVSVPSLQGTITEIISLPFVCKGLFFSSEKKVLGVSVRGNKVFLGGFVAALLDSDFPPVGKVFFQFVLSLLSSILHVIHILPSH
jgi:hypothetical protein